MRFLTLLVLLTYSLELVPHAHAVPALGIVSQVAGQMSWLSVFFMMFLVFSLGLLGLVLMHIKKHFSRYLCLVFLMSLAFGYWMMSSSDSSLMNMEFHQNPSSSVSVQEVYADKDAVLLDIREPAEWERGSIPSSLKIRYADIFDGQWGGFDQTSRVYVFCSSGSRARSVTEFLVEQGINASVVRGGVKAWSSAEYPWTGVPDFTGDERLASFRRPLTASEVEEYRSEGVVILDARSAEDFEWWSVPGSYSVPYLYTPRQDLGRLFDQIPESVPVIPLCDGSDFSCFSAQMISLIAQERGHEVIGRISDLRTFR